MHNLTGSEISSKSSLPSSSPILSPILSPRKSLRTPWPRLEASRYSVSLARRMVTQVLSICQVDPGPQLRAPRLKVTFTRVLRLVGERLVVVCLMVRDQVGFGRHDIVIWLWSLLKPTPSS
jgi:hypothetical protein